jgi:hypothetical protein
MMTYQVRPRLSFIGRVSEEGKRIFTSLVIFLPEWETFFSHTHKKEPVHLLEERAGKMKFYSHQI